MPTEEFLSWNILSSRFSAWFLSLASFSHSWRAALFSLVKVIWYFTTLYEAGSRLVSCADGWLTWVVCAPSVSASSSSLDISWWCQPPWSAPSPHHRAPDRCRFASLGAAGTPLRCAGDWLWPCTPSPKPSCAPWNISALVYILYCLLALYWFYSAGKVCPSCKHRVILTCRFSISFSMALISLMSSCFQNVMSSRLFDSFLVFSACLLLVLSSVSCLGKSMAVVNQFILSELKTNYWWDVL